MFLSPSPPPTAVPAAGRLCLQPTTILLRSLPYRPRPARAPQKSRLPRPPSPSRLHQGVLPRRPTRSRPLARPRPPHPRLTLRRPIRSSRHPTVSPLERVNVQQHPLAIHPQLWTMALGPAGPLDHLPGVPSPHRESHRRDRLHPTSRPLLLTLRRNQTVPIQSEHDRAEAVGTTLLRLTSPPGDTPTAPTTLDVVGDAAELRSADSVADYALAD